MSQTTQRSNKPNSGSLPHSPLDPPGGRLRPARVIAAACYFCTFITTQLGQSDTIFIRPVSSIDGARLGDIGVFEVSWKDFGYMSNVTRGRALGSQGFLSGGFHRAHDRDQINLNQVEHAFLVLYQICRSCAICEPNLSAQSSYLYLARYKLIPKQLVLAPLYPDKPSVYVCYSEHQGKYGKSRIIGAVLLLTEIIEMKRKSKK